MENSESQGHRLSSYASPSSNKHSPKPPKTPTEKCSSGSGSKENSLSPYHLISGYSYSSINSQTKESHVNCAFKCTCNKSSYNCMKSPKSNNDNFTKPAKVICDAATSPNRFNQQGPQNNLRSINTKGSAVYNEIRISDDKKITSKIDRSTRRLVATRNAATSPNLDIRKGFSPKQHYDLLERTSDLTNKTLLEKSNSLGESKPCRPLRTTRSLSPRPPIRHQHAIMVSDENDIISVKVSPNEDFDDNITEKISLNSDGGAKRKHKAHSEQTSPNLSNCEETFTYDCSTNNKSTGCLVYVPSDPWMKMSDIVDSRFNTYFKDKNKKNSKYFEETRSLSRPNLSPIEKDNPWIWRKSAGKNFITSLKNKGKSSKQETYRQAKSFSATKFDFVDLGKLTLPPTSSGDICSNPCVKPEPLSTAVRPKLQRCKSPVIIDDEFSSSLDTQKPCTCTNEFKQNLNSPHKDNSKESLLPQSNKNLLNVTNFNLMQSRHSFSSISKKDDELQLNIRRLSEQMKHNVTSSGADFTDYLNQFRCNESEKSNPKHLRNSSKNSDPVLETTC